MKLNEIKVLLLEDYKTAKVAFIRQGAPEYEVNYILQNFRHLAQKNQWMGNERNIDWWVKQGWDVFKGRVITKMHHPTKTGIKKAKNRGNAATLLDNEHWLIVAPLDIDASCHYGRNTDWCTAKRDEKMSFNRYFYQSRRILVYVINKHTHKKWALIATAGLNPIVLEIRGQKHDALITFQEFRTETHLIIDHILHLLMPYLSAIRRAQHSLP